MGFLMRHLPVILLKLLAMSLNISVELYFYSESCLFDIWINGLLLSCLLYLQINHHLKQTNRIQLGKKITSLRGRPQSMYSEQVLMNVLTATEKALVIIFFSDLQMYQYYIQVSFLCACV